jgi:hypothetical protein
MTTPPPAFDDLDGIRQHDIMDAVNEGRAVEDPDLAPAAVEWARRQQRNHRSLAAYTVVGLTAFGVGVWLWGDAASRTTFYIAVFSIGLIGGPMFATFHYKTRRAEHANLRGHDGLVTTALSLGERIAAGLLALVAGQLTAAAGSAAVFVLLRLGGQTADDAAWYWSIPGVMVWLAVALLVYRHLTDRS